MPVCFIEELRRNQVFFSNAFRSVDYSSVVQYGGTVMLRYLSELYEAEVGHRPNSAEMPQLEFYITGAKHMTRHWALRDMRETPEQMAQLFLTSMPTFMLPHLEPDPTCQVEGRMEL